MTITDPESNAYLPVNMRSHSDCLFNCSFSCHNIISSIVKVKELFANSIFKIKAVHIYIYIYILMILYMYIDILFNSYNRR